MNLAHLLLRSARWLPDKPAIAVGQQPVITYGELTARVPGMAAFAAGSTVHFRVDSEEHLMFFDDHRSRRMAME